jgi:hypothetical protein
VFVRLELPKQPPLNKKRTRSAGSLRRGYPRTNSGSDPLHGECIVNDATVHVAEPSDRAHAPDIEHAIDDDVIVETLLIAGASSHIVTPALTKVTMMASRSGDGRQCAERAGGAARWGGTVTIGDSVEG